MRRSNTLDRVSTCKWRKTRGSPRVNPLCAGRTCEGRGERARLSRCLNSFRVRHGNRHGEALSAEEVLRRATQAEAIPEEGFRTNRLSDDRIPDGARDLDSGCIRKVLSGRAAISGGENPDKPQESTRREVWLRFLCDRVFLPLYQPILGSFRS